MGSVNEKWSAFADEVIEQRYRNGGAEACLRFLPGRTKAAIMQRAFRLGIRTRLNPAAREVDLWPRDPAERAADLALRQFRECQPAANLCWSLGVVA